MKQFRIIFFAILFLAVFSCKQGNGDSTIESRVRGMGLVDIAEVSEGKIAVKLVYATPYNFMGRVLYKDFNKAFVQPDLAVMLMKAQELLKRERPDLNILVYDAGRPLSIQKEMWEMVKDTDMKDFVADPTNGGGMHNFGAAVDVTLMDSAGEPLQMGSTYDFFGDEARVDIEETLLQEGKITKRELENRLLLRKVMTDAGFLTFELEWWHFNMMPSAQVRQTFKVIE